MRVRAIAATDSRRKKTALMPRRTIARSNQRMPYKNSGAIHQLPCLPYPGHNASKHPNQHILASYHELDLLIIGFPFQQWPKFHQEATRHTLTGSAQRCTP
jgi:hypothetical protein